MNCRGCGKDIKEGEHHNCHFGKDVSNFAGNKSALSDGLDGFGDLTTSDLYTALDRLYERGWRDRHKGRDYDPRGTVEWGVVEMLFRKQKSV